MLTKPGWPESLAPLPLLDPELLLDLAVDPAAEGV